MSLYKQKIIRKAIITTCLIQDFEADFLWKVSLKILNSGIILKTFIHVILLYISASSIVIQSNLNVLSSLNFTVTVETFQLLCFLTKSQFIVAKSVNKLDRFIGQFLDYIKTYKIQYILCTIYLAVSYVLHLILLTWVQFRIISMAMTRSYRLHKLGTPKLLRTDRRTEWTHY